MLVKIICTNICGSDVKNWKGASSVGLSDKPTCQGHEFIGEIYQLGEGVTTDSMGSSVHVGRQSRSALLHHLQELPDVQDRTLRSV